MISDRARPEQGTSCSVQAQFHFCVITLTIDWKHTEYPAMLRCERLSFAREDVLKHEPEALRRFLFREDLANRGEDVVYRVQV